MNFSNAPFVSFLSPIISNPSRRLGLVKTALVLLLVWIPVTVTGQDGDMVLKYGPNPEIIDVSEIEIAIIGWEWQANVFEKQIVLIEETKQKWLAGIEQTYERNHKLQKSLAEVGLPFPVDTSTAERIESSIRKIENQLVGSTARIQQVAEQSAMRQTQLQLETRLREQETEMLEQLLNANMQQLARLEVLVEKKVASSQQIDELQIEITELRSKIDQARTGTELVKVSGSSEAAFELRIARESHISFTQELDRLKAQKVKLLTTRAIQEIELLNINHGIAMRMIEMAEARQMELRLENTRNLAMIELAKERLRGLDLDKKTDDQPDKD